MSVQDDFGPSVQLDVWRFDGDALVETPHAIATEVPCTIRANDVELATLQCTPCHLQELAVGFMYSSGFIASFNEVNELHVDSQRWVVTCSLARTPDPDLLTRRVYTAGCGKGVMYADLSELASRGPLQSPLQVDAGSIVKLATWLQHCSALYRDTGTVHSAALSIAGAAPQAAIDDVGRHNAVDKVIGEHLMRAAGFADVVLICSGRISSEILHKARKAGIPMVVARGAPTHQAVLRARDMGVTVVGFARGGRFTVYSHSERICV